MNNNINILGKEIPRLGMGCWAIGGTWGPDDDTPFGWTNVKDDLSIKALKKAYDLGIRLFDTAPTYGYGHSEKILGQALKDVRKDIILATKFGYPCDDIKKIGLGETATKDSILKECNESLRRLQTDYIDVYQLHINDMETEKLTEVIEACEQLKTQGKIRAYGWSTDFIPSADKFLNDSTGEFIQFDLNVFRNNQEMIEVLAKHNAIGFNRQPLAMGLLTGKFNASSQIPADDIRASGMEWLTYFDHGRPTQKYLDMLDAVREILTSDGRSLAQGALAWIWGSSSRVVPIPGFKRNYQVVENIASLDFSSLKSEQIDAINQLIPTFE